MAHFAELNEGVVTRVIVVNNDVINNLPFPESEEIGVAFCRSLFGEETQWKQTSYNSTFRFNYAGAGFTFDATVLPHGAFIPPSPGPGWVLDTTTYKWVLNDAS